MIVADGVELPLEQSVDPQDDNIGRKIVGGGAWRMIAYGFATIIAVVATSIISRTIGPADFAAFTTALSLIAVAMQISDFGLLALGLREYAALSGDDRLRTYRAMITLRLGFSFFAAVAIVAFAIVAGYSQGLIIGLAVAAVGTCFGSLSTSYYVPLQAAYRLNVLAGLDALRQGMSSTLMVLAALTIGSVGVIVATNLPVALVMVVATAAIVYKETTLRPSWDVATMRDLLGDVGTFAVAASIGTMYAYIAQVVSDSVLTPFESGQFALAFRVYAVLLLGWLTAVSGAFPLLVTSSREDMQRMVYATRRLLQTSVLVGTAALVGLVTGAEFVVAVLGGAKFEEATHLIALIGLALPATFTLVTGSTVLLASGRHRELVGVSVVGAIVSVAITWFAASEWSGTGAALGIVIGEVIIATGYLVVISRIDRDALPGLTWLLTVAFAGALGCSIALIGLPGLVAGILGGLVFLVAGLVLRIFPPELTDRVPGLKKS